jgi:hypothetical protein
VNSVREQKHLDTLAYRIKREWENHVKKAELRLGGKKELKCT